MEASPFNILHLRPGRYSRKHIDRQYQTVRREILRASGPDRQRRLDDAFIAHAMLRSPSGQISLMKRVRRDVTTRRRRHVPMAIQTARPLRVATVAPAMADPPSKADSDPHRRFARMVVDHVESGILRLTSRRRLVLLAQGLGIAPFKANLVIAEVLYDLEHGRRPLGRDVAGSPAEAVDVPRRRRYGLRLSVAVAVAIAADLLLLLWLT